MKSHGKSALAALLVLVTLSPVNGAAGQGRNQQRPARDQQRQDRDQQRQGRGQQNGSESRIRRGFAIAPVPLDMNGKNRALVGLGS